LKDLYYWLKICPKDLAEDFMNMRTLDRILTYLGNWQDHVILKKKIKQYKQDLPKRNEEKVMLKDLEKKLVLTQKEILDRAIKKWEEIRNKKAILPVSLSTSESV